MFSNFNVTKKLTVNVFPFFLSELQAEVTLCFMLTDWYVYNFGIALDKAPLFFFQSKSTVFDLVTALCA